MMPPQLGSQNPHGIIPYSFVEYNIDRLSQAEAVPNLQTEEVKVSIIEDSLGKKPSIIEDSLEKKSSDRTSDYSQFP
jgi:hypothetical protein